MPFFRKADFYHRTADAAMKSNDLPSKANFPAYREQALVAMRHRKAKAAKVAAAAATATTGASAPTTTTATTATPAPPKDRPTITGGEPDDSEVPVPEAITLSESESGLPGRCPHEVSAEFAAMELE
ncbi:hypothetical protein PG988_003524 [Apiospora saccharicola]